MYVTLIFSITVLRFICALSAEHQYHEDSNLMDSLSQRHRHISKRSDGDVFQKVGNATLRKCQCEGEEVWTGDSCQAASTYVAILDPQSGNRFGASTQEFGFVNVSKLRCSDTSQILVTLDSNRQSEFPFSILPSGNLDWQQTEFKDYCVDHTLDHKGDPSSWEAWLCLSPPSISQCCPPGQVLDTNNACIFGNTNAFAPPVMVDDIYVNWPSFGDERVTQLTCEENAEVIFVELGDEDHGLLYYQGEAVLTWTPPAFPDSPKMHQNFCVGVKSEEKGDKPSTYVAGLCYNDPIAAYQKECQDSTCVRKCCPENHWFTESCEVVQEESQIWKPVFHSPEDISLEVSAPDNLKIIHGYPLCQHHFLLNPQDSIDDRFYLMSNGFLNVPSYSRPYSAAKYCLDNFLGANETVQLALVCFQEAINENNCDVAHFYVYPILMLVSCLFLVLTIAVYASIRELHDKLHGKCLLSLVSALCTGYITVTVSAFTFGDLSVTACRAVAFIRQFNNLSSFFWLNIMCFDIWRTLRSMQTAKTEPGMWTRFAKYSAYAWGCPLVISVATIIVETLPPDHEVIRPNFSVKCWFQKPISMWLYLYGFILLIIIVNIIFFALVAKILIAAHNNPSLRRSGNYNRDRLWLYVKLFLVMGLSWLAEVISYQEGTCQAWIVTDIVNCLQGLIIFLIFVCKKSTREKIRTRCCQRRCDPGSTTRTSYLNSSSSSSSGHKKMTLLTSLRKTSKNRNVTSQRSARHGSTANSGIQKAGDLPDIINGTKSEKNHPSESGQRVLLGTTEAEITLEQGDKNETEVTVKGISGESSASCSESSGSNNHLHLTPNDPHNRQLIDEESSKDTHGGPETFDTPKEGDIEENDDKGQVPLRRTSSASGRESRNSNERSHLNPADVSHNERPVGEARALRDSSEDEDDVPTEVTPMRKMHETDL